MLDVFEIQQRIKKDSKDFLGFKKIENHIFRCQEKLKTTKHKDYYNQKLKALIKIKDSYGFKVLNND